MNLRSFKIGQEIRVFLFVFFTETNRQTCLLGGNSEDLFRRDIPDGLAYSKLTSHTILRKEDSNLHLNAKTEGLSVIFISQLRPPHT